MDKVVLTNAQAEAIENIKEVYSDYTFIIKSHVEHSDGWIGKSEPLNDLNLDSLIRSLYIGYEVERTPEEELLKEYHFNKNHSDSKWGYYADGIKAAIDILDITIEGINGDSDE